VLAAVAGHELEPRINSELMQSVLEVATPVCHTPAGVQQQLLRIRRYVTDIAREKGLRVGSAGTHPFSLFETQRITAKDRYRALVDQMQYIARRELIFGMHVHVSVDDAEKAIQDRKSTRLNSSHSQISYAVFCLKKKTKPARVSLLILSVFVSTTRIFLSKTNALVNSKLLAQTVPQSLLYFSVSLVSSSPPSVCS